MQRALGARSRCVSSNPSQLRRMIRNGSVYAMSPSSACCRTPLQSACGRDPSLLNQKRQVVYPIFFTYPARVDDMGQIVFCVRDNKIGVPNRIVAVAGPRFLRRRNARGRLDCFESSFGSSEADKMFIEIVEPPAQFHRGVPCGIGCNKNELDLIGHTRGQFL